MVDGNNFILGQVNDAESETQLHRRGNNVGSGLFVNNHNGQGIQGTGAPGFPGVSGFSEQGDGVLGVSASGSGIHGESQAANKNWAGTFDGNVQVKGTLFKNAGGFRIDHPLEPDEKYLLHSFVESSEMMNVYAGNVSLDDDGGAYVELPSWFEPLNRDFRYQLTCVGSFAPVFIAEEIRNGAFKIAGGQPGMKVSWQVVGTRDDDYARENPILVELDKGTHESRPKDNGAAPGPASPSHRAMVSSRA
jgi:hypothetical protein